MAYRVTNTHPVAGRNLPGDNDLMACCHDLDRHPGTRIFKDNVVKDLIGDQITELIGVTNTHRLSSFLSKHRHS